MADLRHRSRDKRLRQLLAAKAKPSTSIEPETNALVVSVARGFCTVADENGERLVRCNVPVAPGDEAAIRHEKVSGTAARRTTLARTDPAIHTANSSSRRTSISSSSSRRWSTRRSARGWSTVI